jgi:transcriptional regulator with XRE-family HTH domain
MNAKTDAPREAPREEDFERLVAQEMLIESATEKLLELMEREGVSKAELARRIGKSRPFITQVMDGSRNMTLRTVADLAFALGHQLRLGEAETPHALSGRISEPKVMPADQVSGWAHDRAKRNWAAHVTPVRDSPAWGPPTSHLRRVRVTRRGEPIEMTNRMTA